MHHSAALPGASNTALPITTSCSFNRSLWGATGNLIGREARAFINAGLAGSTFWTPVINIVRDVRFAPLATSSGSGSTTTPFPSPPRPPRIHRA